MKKTRIILIAAMLMLAMVFVTACSSDKNAEGTTKGLVTETSMNTVTIQVPNGSEFTFSIEGVEITGGDSIEDGDEITIFYTGKFDEKNSAQDVKVTKIQIDNKAKESKPEASKPKEEQPKKEDPKPSTPSQPASSDEQQFIGVIDAIGNDGTMQIANPGGLDLLFDVSSAKVDGGLKVGDSVIVFYKNGDLVDTDQLQKIEVTKVTAQ